MRFESVGVLAFFIGSATIAPSSTMNLPAKEKSALVSVFETTNGTAWKDHNGWLTADDPCEWSGVMCNWDDAAGTGHPSWTVVGLNLPFNNIKGALPSALLDLPNLKTIDLRGNELTGEVPEAWLERWDRNEFELFLGGNRFSNFVQRVRITFSSPSVLCAFDGDTHYFVELTESGSAHFESTRCSSRRFESRDTYCLVKDGTGPSLDRFGRALKRLGFENLAPQYSYPFTFATHQIFLTTTVWYGDGHSKSVETYGGQSPVEAYAVEQMVWGLVEQVTWEHQSKKKECSER